MHVLLLQGLQSLLAVAILSPLLALAKVYQHAAELDPTVQFDFIVIGSGPGGSTVASRLSEDPKFNVLLIEAGGDNEGILDLSVPSFILNFPPAYRWNYTITPSPAIANRTIEYMRGRVLGGSSSINGMIYSRGSADDYNSYARISGDNGWSWDSLLPYIKKNERYVAPTSGRNTSGEYDVRYHGLKVSQPPLETTGYDKRCLDVTRAQAEFPFLTDMNSGRPIGLAQLIYSREAWQQSTIGNGERNSAAVAFLNPTVRKRTNLSILLNTHVTRILETKTNGTSKTPLLRTVEFGDHTTRRVVGKLTAAKEVILSAGVVGSAHILLNSGIGDKHELGALGIISVTHIPDVGKKMSEHPGADIYFSAERFEGIPPFDQNTALKQWITDRTGPLSKTPHRLLLWSRLPKSSPLWRNYADPSSGPDAPHFEIILLAGGSIALRSPDPFDDPLIDDGLLKTSYDLEAMKEGFRLAKRFFSGHPWDNYLVNASFADPDTMSPYQWEAALRNGVKTNYHGVGTAAMGVRVVDASVIPYVPAGHTQVPVYIFSERASDLIKAAWRS
ncbi:alcohol oxidase [Coprinellus micaceus]|uniref:pyranose dehydrogenase (acceptor) n=1 Tax=Coprinellus micaceus TaxID=71717 RepID=A0A4Y7T132_COPMI|nr:alcohol oxidase [Coprinellus micaceus]